MTSSLFKKVHLSAHEEKEPSQIFLNSGKFSNEITVNSVDDLTPKEKMLEEETPLTDYYVTGIRIYACSHCLLQNNPVIELFQLPVTYRRNSRANSCSTLKQFES